MFQHDAIPFGIGRHPVVGRAARHQRDRWIVPAHHLAGFTRLLAVIFGFEMPDLPRTIHLVAEAPVFDAVGIAVTVGDAHIGILRPGGRVAVLDEVRRVLNRRGAHVDAHHRLGLDLLGEFHELVGAKLIGFDRLPSEIAAVRTLIFGTNAIFPAIAAEEVAAGIAHRAEVQFFQRRQHIFAQTTLIGVRRGRVVDAFIDGTPHMLSKTAEDQRRNRTDGSMRIEIDTRFL